MKINWFYYVDGVNVLSPEIREVDGDKEAGEHIMQIEKTDPIEFHLQYLYPDGWVNGNIHDLRLKQKLYEQEDKKG